MRNQQLLQRERFRQHKVKMNCNGRRHMNSELLQFSARYMLRNVSYVSWTDIQTGVGHRGCCDSGMLTWHIPVTTDGLPSKINAHMDSQHGEVSISHISSSSRRSVSSLHSLICIQPSLRCHVAEPYLDPWNHHQAFFRAPLAIIIQAATS